MKFSRAIKEKSRLNCVAIIFLVAFLVWGYVFRGFLTNTLMLHSDAHAYYEHFKYYVDNIRLGVYPMWEPTRQTGLPIELFMRRIGSYNPFIFLILILNTIGISYPSSYMLFLTIYYFTGIAGFYLLAKQIFQDRRMAFVASMLLMFSSLGTRLFDSYFHLTMIPMIWFFYFLLAFAEKQEKLYFLGITFTTMILVTTYIPFYFMTIFMCFLICFSVFYFRVLQTFLKHGRNFIRNNKFFVCLCTLVLVLSMLPGILLFQNMSKGEIVLPPRNYNYANTPTPPKTLGVDEYNVTKWGIMEDLLYSASFTDLHRFKFALFYLPIFACILFFLGLFTDINKRLLFFFALGLLIFLLGSPHTIPLYAFLREHISYFKYFRNLHFFLWLAILPLIILLLTGQFQAFLNYQPRNKKIRYALFAFLLTVHAGFAFFLLTRGDEILSSYLVILSSFIFFVLYFSGRLKMKTAGFLSVFLLLIIIQPLEVYHYLSKNSTRVPEGVEDPYRYAGAKPFLSFVLPERAELAEIAANQLKPPENTASVIEKKRTNMYMGTLWHSLLRQNLKSKILGEYVSKKLLVYDHVEYMSDADLDFEKVGRAFRDNQNTAFISTDKSNLTATKFSGQSAAHPQIITPDSSQVRVVGFDANHLELKTHFDSRKFLVYNDGFHSGWKAFIDGKKTDLWRTNVAFKGLWVPQGEHNVYFRFGSFWRYVLDYLLVAVFMIVFVCLIILLGRIPLSRLFIARRM